MLVKKTEGHQSRFVRALTILDSNIGSIIVSCRETMVPLEGPNLSTEHCILLALSCSLKYFNHTLMSLHIPPPDCVIIFQISVDIDPTRLEE